MSDWLNKYGGHSEPQKSNSPTVDDIKAEAANRGMTYQDLFYALCKERGINPQNPINVLMQLLGGKK